MGARANKMRNQTSRFLTEKIKDDIIENKPQTAEQIVLTTPSRKIIYTNVQMSEKQQEEFSKKLNIISKEMAKSFFKGLFFFITTPIWIYNKIKLNGGKKWI